MTDFKLQDIDHDDKFPTLAGNLLIASPNMDDPRFQKSVVFLFAHTAKGSMGLIINQIIPNLTISDIAEPFKIDVPKDHKSKDIFLGGPVMTDRGFVLHTPDYKEASTIELSDTISLTATQEVLRLILRGIGPKKCLILFGYAGWDGGQLEKEIQKDSWVVSPAPINFIFNDTPDQKWPNALSMLGIRSDMPWEGHGQA